MRSERTACEIFTDTEQYVTDVDVIIAYKEIRDLVHRGDKLSLSEVITLQNKLWNLYDALDKAINERGSTFEDH